MMLYWKQIKTPILIFGMVLVLKDEMSSVSFWLEVLQSYHVEKMGPSFIGWSLLLYCWSAVISVLVIYFLYLSIGALNYYSGAPLPSRLSLDL